MSKPVVTEEMVDAAINARPGGDVIQGFYYDSSDLHVIRDVTKPFPEQELWRIISPDYDAAHASMMHEIERIKMRRSLEAALSPAFERQEPVAWRKKLSDIEGHFTYSNVNMEGDWEPLFASPVNETERMREALRSIAANTCCDRCMEAALVARAALGRKP